MDQLSNPKISEISLGQLSKSGCTVKVIWTSGGVSHVIAEGEI